MAGVDASGADFNSADLRGANLAGLAASSANFDNANLSSANLSRGNLQEARFSLLDWTTPFYWGKCTPGRTSCFNEVREQSKGKLPGDLFRTPFEPLPPNWDPERNPGISRSVGARFIATDWVR